MIVEMKDFSASERDPKKHLLSGNEGAVLSVIHHLGVIGHKEACSCCDVAAEGKWDAFFFDS